MFYILRTRSNSFNRSEHPMDQLMLESYSGMLLFGPFSVTKCKNKNFFFEQNFKIWVAFILKYPVVSKWDPGCTSFFSVPQFTEFWILCRGLYFEGVSNVGLSLPKNIIIFPKFLVISLKPFSTFGWLNSDLHAPNFIMTHSLALVDGWMMCHGYIVGWSMVMRTCTEYK